MYKNIKAYIWIFTIYIINIYCKIFFCILLFIYIFCEILYKKYLIFLEPHLFLEILRWLAICHWHFRHELQQQPTSQAFIISSAVSWSSTDLSVTDYIYFSYLTSSLLFHLHPALSCTSDRAVTCCNFYLVVLQSIWTRTMHVLCSVESPLQNHSLISCLHLLFSAYSLLYSSLLTCIFFLCHFSSLRSSALLIHKSLQEGHTDWKPLTPGTMVNWF